MATHLRDAIAVNRARAEHYAAATQGRSRPLSEQLIATEHATLPIAVWLDRRAAPFNARGIGIVAHDFVPMEPLPAWDTPPRWAGVSTAPSRRRLRHALRQLRREGRRLSGAGAWMDLANLTAEHIQRVHLQQARQQAHFAMTLHLLESIGMGARNAARYVREDPSVQPLARDLMRVQLLGLRIAIALDLQAQHLHIYDVGILVNDVPAIPFP